MTKAREVVTAAPLHLPAAAANGDGDGDGDGDSDDGGGCGGSGVSGIVRGGDDSKPFSTTPTATKEKAIGGSEATGAGDVNGGGPGHSVDASLYTVFPLEEMHRCGQV